MMNLFSQSLNISFSMLRHKHSHKNEVLVDISSKVISYFMNVHIVPVLQKVHAHQFWSPSSLLAVMHHMSQKDTSCSQQNLFSLIHTDDIANVLRHSSKGDATEFLVSSLKMVLGWGFNKTSKPVIGIVGLWLNCHGEVDSCGWCGTKLMISKIKQ